MGRINMNLSSNTLLFGRSSNDIQQRPPVATAHRTASHAHSTPASVLSHLVDKCVSGACLVILTPVIVAVWVAIRRCAPVFPITRPEALKRPMRISMKPDVVRTRHVLFASKIEMTSPIAAHARA